MFKDSPLFDFDLDWISIPEQNQNNVDPLNTAVEQPANFDVTGVQWWQSQLWWDSVDEIQKSETIVEDINTNPVGDDWLLKEDQAVENSEQNIVETWETALSSDLVWISENSEWNVQPEVQSQPTVDNFSWYQYQQPDSQVNDTEEDLSAMVDWLNNWTCYRKSNNDDEIYGCITWNLHNVFRWWKRSIRLWWKS